jgi:UDPglucose 6-dehydrogenase
LERVTVIGLGRIGLCLALNVARAGYEVLGVDTNRELVGLINNKAFQTCEPGVEEALRAARGFTATHLIETVPGFDARMILVAVATPATAEGGYDHAQADRVMRDLCALGAAAERTELALVCTTLPGYCGSRADSVREQHYFLSYTPGFVAQGSILRDQQFPDQVLIGEADPEAGDALERLYRRVCLNQPAVHRMSTLSAELAKLATNCALTMKIAFANAIGDLATRVGAEPEKILAAVGADTRIGSQFLRYGSGYGGPCFPRDNRALNLYAERHGCELLQSRATDEMNRRHLAFQVGEYLRTYAPGQPIHFHSVTYKAGTEILEESQPLALAVELARVGRKVVIHEAPAVVTRLRDQFGELFEYHVRS